LPPEWVEKLLNHLWELEAKTTGGGVNVAALICLGLFMASGALTRALTTCFDRVIWFIERWREWKSSQKHGLPYIAQEVPQSDPRFKLGMVLAAVAVCCLVSLTVMNS
jgi:hypothetical protein